jgi:hypothetical protein
LRKLTKPSCRTGDCVLQPHLEKRTNASSLCARRGRSIARKASALYRSPSPRFELGVPRRLLCGTLDMVSHRPRSRQRARCRTS